MTSDAGQPEPRRDQPRQGAKTRRWIASATVERELKFIAERPQAEELHKRISARLAPLAYCANFPVTFTRTTYFDSIDGYYLRSSERAVATRLRLREYAGCHGGQASVPTFDRFCYLDLKRSSGNRRHKLRLVADRQELERFLTQPPARQSNPNLSHLLTQPGFADIAAEVDARVLNPVVGTWYRRSTYASRSIRVTIDRDILFTVPLDPSQGWPALDDIVGYGPDCIVEIKTYDEKRAVPEWLVRPLSRLRARQVRVSKFALACHALHSRWGGASVAFPTRPFTEGLGPIQERTSVFKAPS